MVRNIGVIMDSHASMEAHVNSVARAAYIYLLNIGRMWIYLTQAATEH